MKEKISELLRKVGVSTQTVAAFTDAYTIGPWRNDGERDEWAKNLASLIESMLAAKPVLEVKQFLELQAARMDAAVAGNPTAHQQALDNLTQFLKEKTAV